MKIRSLACKKVRCSPYEKVPNPFSDRRCTRACERKKGRFTGLSIDFKGVETNSKFAISEKRWLGDSIILIRL